MIRLAVILLTATTTAVSAQAPASASPDTTGQDPNAVTAYSVKSGRLMLSSRANPKPTSLPDGTYSNESEVTLAVVDGRITRIQEPTGGITEIASMRLNRRKLITLTPSTNALMAVSEVLLPSGTFRSEDGRSSVTTVFGRPTAFNLAGGT